MGLSKLIFLPSLTFVGANEDCVTTGYEAVFPTCEEYNSLSCECVNMLCFEEMFSLIADDSINKHL